MTLEQQVRTLRQLKADGEATVTQLTSRIHALENEANLGASEQASEEQLSAQMLDAGFELENYDAAHLLGGVLLRGGDDSDGEQTDASEHPRFVPFGEVDNEDTLNESINDLLSF